jgi:3-methyl-2-oxobutanoate hydroxymethyltransferase
VLVMHDMLGLHHGKPARFVRNFMQDADSITGAFQRFHHDVRAGHYPAPEHAFNIEL